MTYFTQTSDAPYDQCIYELHMIEGKKTIWDDYEELRNYWMLNQGWNMSHIVVKPRKVRKKSKGGFKDT